MDEALTLLNQAANLGHPFATTALAHMYRLGAGVPRDDARAEALVARIAQTSNPVVLCQIGLTYLPVGGDPPLTGNADRAIGYLLRAVQQGYGRRWPARFLLHDGVSGAPGSGVRLPVAVDRRGKATAMRGCISSACARGSRPNKPRRRSGG